MFLCLLGERKDTFQNDETSLLSFTFEFRNFQLPFGRLDASTLLIIITAFKLSMQNALSPERRIMLQYNSTVRSFGKRGKTIVITMITRFEFSEKL